MSSFAFNEYAREYTEFYRKQQAAAERVEAARWRSPKANRQWLKRSVSAGKKAAPLVLFSMAMATGNGAMHTADSQGYAFDAPRTENVHAQYRNKTESNADERSRAYQDIEQEKSPLKVAPTPIHDETYDYTNEAGQYMYVPNQDELKMYFKEGKDCVLVDISQMQNPLLKEGIARGEIYLAEFQTKADWDEHVAYLSPLPSTNGMNMVTKGQNPDLYQAITNRDAYVLAIVRKIDGPAKPGQNPQYEEQVDQFASVINPDAAQPLNLGENKIAPQIPPTQSEQAATQNARQAHPDMGPNIGGEQAIQESLKPPLIPPTRAEAAETPAGPKIPPLHQAATATAETPAPPIIPSTHEAATATEAPVSPIIPPTHEAATATSQTPIPVNIPTFEATATPESSPIVPNIPPTRPAASPTSTFGTPTSEAIPPISPSKTSTPEVATPATPEATPGTVIASTKSTPRAEATPVVGPASHEHGWPFGMSHDTKKAVGEALGGILAAGVAAYWLRRQKVFEKYGLNKESAQVRMAHALDKLRNLHGGGAAATGETGPTIPVPPSPAGRQTRLGGQPKPSAESPNTPPWEPLVPPVAPAEEPGVSEPAVEPVPVIPTEEAGRVGIAEFGTPSTEIPTPVEGAVTPEMLATLEAMPNKSASAEQFLAENKDLLKHQARIGDYTYTFTEPIEGHLPMVMALVYETKADNPTLESRFWHFSDMEHQWKALPGFRDRSWKPLEGDQANPGTNPIQSTTVLPPIYEELANLPTTGKPGHDYNVLTKYVPVSEDLGRPGAFADEIKFSDKQVQFHNREWSDYQSDAKKLMGWYTELIANNSLGYQDFRFNSSKYRTIEDIVESSNTLNAPQLTQMRTLLDIMKEMHRKFARLGDEGKSDEAGQLAHNLGYVNVREPDQNNPEIRNLVEAYNAAVGPFIEYAATSLNTPRSIVPDFAPENVVNTYEIPLHQGDESSKTVVEEFDVDSPEGDRLRIAMAQDPEGRVFVHDIYDPRVKMDSYGTPELKTNMGILVHGPDQLEESTFGLPDRYVTDSPYEPYHFFYLGMPPYASVNKFWEENIEPVKRYKKYKDEQLAGKTATEPAEAPSTTSMPTSTRAPRLVEGVIRDGKLIRKPEGEAMHDEAVHDNDEQPEAEAGPVEAPTAEPAARPAPTLVEGAIGPDGKLTTKTKLEEEKRRAEAHSAHTRATEPTEDPDRTDSTESGRLIPSGVGAYWTLTRELARQRYLAERARRTADRQGNDAEVEPTTAESTLQAPEASSAPPTEAAPAGPRKLTEGFRLPDGRIITGQQLQDYRRQQTIQQERERLESLARSNPLALGSSSEYQAGQRPGEIPAIPATTGSSEPQRRPQLGDVNILPRGEKPLVTPETPMPNALRAREVRILPNEEQKRLRDLSQEDTVPLQQLARAYGYLAQTREMQILQEDWANMKPPTRLLLLTSLAEHAAPYGPETPKIPDSVPEQMWQDRRARAEQDRQARIQNYAINTVGSQLKFRAENQARQDIEPAINTDQATDNRTEEQKRLAKGDSLEVLHQKQSEKAFAKLRFEPLHPIQKNQRTSIELNSAKDRFEDIRTSFIKLNVNRRIAQFPGAIYEDLKQFTDQDLKSVREKWPNLSIEERQQILSDMVTGKFVDDSIKRHHPDAQDDISEDHNKPDQPVPQSDNGSRPDDGNTEPNEDAGSEDKNNEEQARRDLESRFIGLVNRRAKSVERASVEPVSSAGQPESSDERTAKEDDEAPPNSMPVTTSAGEPDLFELINGEAPEAESGDNTDDVIRPGRSIDSNSEPRGRSNRRLFRDEVEWVGHRGQLTERQRQRVNEIVTTDALDESDYRYLWSKLIEENEDLAKNNELRSVAAKELQSLQKRWSRLDKDLRQESASMIISGELAARLVDWYDKQHPDRKT